MKLVHIATGMALLLTVIGCATPKAWIPMGGSRADATVTLGYQYGMFEQPQLDHVEGDRLAKQRCAVWGYNGAEAFGAELSQCTSMSNSGCVQMQVTKTYQCTGTGTPGASAHIDMTHTF